MNFLSSPVYAQVVTLQKSGCIYKENPGVSAEVGVPTLRCIEVIVQNALSFASGIVIFVLFVMLLWGGIKYLTSGGDPTKVTSAQDTLKFALLGTVLFVSAYLILNIIQVLFLGDPKDPNNANLFKFEIPR